MNAKEQLTTWLNSAYGMEHSLIKVLENHANDVKDQPAMHSRIARHIEETKRHAELVGRAIESLGDKPSSTKSAMSTMMGTLHGASTGMFDDELVKNVLSDFAAENFEIACYRSLIVAAEDCGHPDIAETCRMILQDEESMAQWLSDQIPEATRMILHQEAHA